MSEEAATETVISDHIRKALECPVCLQTACRIRCCCCHGHIVCDRCFARLLDTEGPVCPICRSPIATTRLTATVETALTNVMRGIKIACSHWPLGCRQLVAIPDVDAHAAACPEAPCAKCFVSTCQWTGGHSQVYEHVSSEHPGSVVSVQGNRYTVQDVRAVLMRRVGRHQAYLLKDARDNMMWMVLSRGPRRSVRVHMMLVNTADRTRATYRVSMGMIATNFYFRARRRVMPRDRDVPENSDTAFAVVRGLILHRKQYENSLTITWNIR